MIHYLFLTLRAHLRQSPSLYLLTLLGVTLGVATVTCIQIVNGSSVAAFRGGLRALSGEAHRSVVGRAPSFDEELLAEVLATEGVEAAWPLVRLEVAEDSGEGEVERYLDVVGVDLYSPMRIPWDVAPGELSRALTREGWVAVSPALAAARGWELGTPVRVSSGSRRATLVVSALVDFRRLSPLASHRLVVMDIAQAQELLGEVGRIDQIDLRIRAGANFDEVSRRLEVALGPGVRVLDEGERVQQTETILAAFRLNLTALSLISVFVGLFLVYQSTLASLVRRRHELGVLRSLGATPRGVLGLVLAEVLLMGALGTALGLPAGWLAARANLDLVSATLTNVYLLEAVDVLAMPPWLPVLAAAVGLGGALLGALGPALDMCRRDTRALLATTTLRERAADLATPLAGLGAVSAALLLAGFVLRDHLGRGGGFALAALLLISLPLLTPAILRALARRVRVTGFGPGYALRSLLVRLESTAVAVAALAVAVTMLVGITVMVASFRRTLEVWIDSAVRADVYVTTPSWRRSQHDARMDDALVEALGRHPGVTSVDRLRRFAGWVGERRVVVGGVDMDLAHGKSRFPPLSGQDPRAFERVREEPVVLIGEALMRKGGYRAGDRVPLHTPGGVRDLEVAAVFYDYTTDQGSVVMDLALMEELFGPAPVNSMSLYLEPGRDPERMVSELRAAFPDTPLWLRSNRRMREEVLAVFDQTFAVTHVLQATSLLIAVAGITLTLLVVAREKLPELALYRALGATRGQILRLFLVKGAAMALLGALIGLVGGALLAAVLILVVNRTCFGWTLQTWWPWVETARQVGWLLAAALVASLYPALHASRAPAAELTREDL